MTRVVRIPNGRRVPLGAYVAAWRAVKAMPPDQLVRGWGHFAEPASRILADFAFGLHDRINLRGGLAIRESRVHPSYWPKAATPRVILDPHEVRAMPPTARRRFAGRVRDD